MGKSAVQCRSCGWFVSEEAKIDPLCPECSAQLHVLRGTEDAVNNQIESYLEPKYREFLYRELFLEARKHNGMLQTAPWEYEPEWEDTWNQLSGRHQRRMIQGCLGDIQRGLQFQDTAAKTRREQIEGTWVQPTNIGWRIEEQLGRGIYNAGPQYVAHPAILGKTIDFGDYDWTVSRGVLDILQRSHNDA